MMFGHYFATDTYDMKFNLGEDFEAEVFLRFEIWFRFHN